MFWVSVSSVDIFPLDVRMHKKTMTKSHGHLYRISILEFLYKNSRGLHTIFSSHNESLIYNHIYYLAFFFI